MTSYKALKETETKPGQFVAIVGAAGGLGHLAIQYANAMGMRVIALDFGPKKKQFCYTMGAEFAVDVSESDVLEQVEEITCGGCHGIVVLATQPSAFTSAVRMCRSGGTIACVGLPAGTFECPIVEVALRRLTIRGSIVGTRKDAAEAVDFASRGLVSCSVELDKLENINNVFTRLRNGQIEGRVVLKISDDMALGTSYVSKSIM